MMNVKVSKWKHGKKKTKWHRLFRTILGRNSIKNKRKRKQKTTKGPDMNLKYTEKRQREEFSLKSKRICYYFEAESVLIF